MQLWPFPVLGGEEIKQENIQRTTRVIKIAFSMGMITEVRKNKSKSEMAKGEGTMIVPPTHLFLCKNKRSLIEIHKRHVQNNKSNF